MLARGPDVFAFVAMGRFAVIPGDGFDSADVVLAIVVRFVWRLPRYRVTSRLYDGIRVHGIRDCRLCDQ